MTRLQLIFAVLAAGLASGCAGRASGGGRGSGGSPASVYDAATLTKEAAMTSADWDLLKQGTFYFGHQSVGTNILDGLKSLGASDSRYAIQVQFAYQAIPSFAIGPALFEKAVGENYQPYTKIASFRDQVTTTLRAGGNVDVAFFKFCYVDFSDTTDVAALAQAYIDEMNRLESSYTSTRFLWTTAPLTLQSDEANIRRNQYARTIRDYAAAHGKHLFDLAALEALGSNGSRCEFTSAGAAFDKLCGEWAASADNPHLNSAAGQRFAKVLALGLIDVRK